MTDNNAKLKYNFLQSSNKKHCATSIVVTYIPILLLAGNIFVFHNAILGFGATSAFLLFNGYVVYEKLKFMLGNIRWIGIALGAFIFFSGVCVISSPFVLFSGISSEQLVGIIVISGIPIVIFRIKDNLPTNPIIFQKITKLNLYDLGLIVAWMVLLIFDVYILLSNSTPDSNFLWKQIPSTHIYVFFFFLLVTGVILFRQTSIFVRSVIIIASIIFACSYALIVVPTLYSPDTWFLLGEVKAALNHDNLQITQSLIEQKTYTSSLDSLKFSQLYVTVWSRGISNTFALYTSQLLSDDSMTFWRSLSPIFALGTTAIVLFRIGYIVSKNHLFSLLLPTSFLFYPGLSYYMSQTVKLSLSMPFFVLGLLFWITFLLHKDRKTLLFALIVTALNFVNYSLFFLILFDVMIISIFVRYVIMGYFNSNRKASLIIIPLLAGTLSLIIPVAETFLGSTFSSFSFSDQLPRIIYWLQEITGYYLPQGTSIPYNQFVMTHTWFIVFHIVILILFWLGVFRFKFDKNIRNVFLIAVLTLYLSSYISENLMTEPHSLGYVSIILHVLEIPFIAFGIFWLFENGSQIIKNHVGRKILVLLFCILIAVLVESSQMVETGSRWVTPADVEATKYILQVQKNDPNYSMISESWGSYPLYYLTGTEKSDGGFYSETVPGLKSTDRALYYYFNMLNSTNFVLFAKAANETNTCTVYYLKPSWVVVSPSELHNVTSILGSPMIFKNKYQETFLFGKSYCAKNNPMESVNGLNLAYLSSSTNQYAISLDKYNEILQKNKTDVNAILGKASVLEQTGQYSDAFEFYDISSKLDANNKEAEDGKSRIINHIFNVTSISNVEYKKLFNISDKILNSNNVTIYNLGAKYEILANVNTYENTFTAYTKLIKNETYDNSTLDTYAHVLSYFPFPSNFDKNVLENDVKIKLIDKLESQADYFISIGQYDQLLIISNNISYLDSTNLSALSYEVSYYIHQKNPVAATLALQNLKHAILIAPNSNLNQALDLESKNKLDESLVVYHNVLVNNQNIFTLELELAKMFIDLGLTSEATTFYLDIPNVYKAQAETWDDMSHVYEKQGKLDFIIPKSLGLVHFDDSYMKNLLAEQAHEYGVYNVSVDGLLLLSNVILTIDPTDIVGLIDRSTCLTSLGKYDEAISDLDVVISSDPRNIEYLNDKGEIYLKMKNYDKALLTFDDALAIEPNDIPTLQNKLFTLITMGNTDGSIDTINKILSIEPNNITTLSYQSILFASIHRDTESSLIDDKILSLDPQDGLVVLNLKSDLYIKSQQYELALPILNKILILQPTNNAVLFNKALVLAQLERNDESLSIIDQLLSYNPTDIGVLNSKGLLLTQMGENTQALDVYNKILSLNSSDTNALEHKNEILIKLQSK